MNRREKRQLEFLRADLAAAQRLLLYFEGDDYSKAFIGVRVEEIAREIRSLEQGRNLGQAAPQGTAGEGGGAMTSEEQAAVDDAEWDETLALAKRQRDEATQRAERAEQHLDALRAARDSLTAMLEDEKAQRIHEARIAGEAIGHLRALTERAMPAWTDEDEAPWAAACDWLDTVKT